MARQIGLCPQLSPWGSSTGLSSRVSVPISSCAAIAVILKRLYQASAKVGSACVAARNADLSDLLDEQGRSEAAIECLRTALRAAPDYADAMLLLQRTNQYADAADYWRRYLASDCQSEWAARARRSLKFCEMQVHLITSA
jgi:tetratricopeptide (TPR) repeat protein